MVKPRLKGYNIENRGIEDNYCSKLKKKEKFETNKLSKIQYQMIKSNQQTEKLDDNQRTEKF